MLDDRHTARLVAAVEGRAYVRDRVGVFEHAGVLAQRPKGHAIEDGDLIMWAPLGGVPWKYVVVGDAEALLASD